jgi:hypothetical protein
VVVDVGGYFGVVHQRAGEGDAWLGCAAHVAFSC